MFLLRSQNEQCLPCVLLVGGLTTSEYSKHDVMSMYISLKCGDDYSCYDSSYAWIVREIVSRNDSKLYSMWVCCLTLGNITADMNQLIKRQTRGKSPSKLTHQYKVRESNCCLAWYRINTATTFEIRLLISGVQFHGQWWYAPSSSQLIFFFFCGQIGSQSWVLRGWQVIDQRWRVIGQYHGQVGKISMKSAKHRQ